MQGSPTPHSLTQQLTRLLAVVLRLLCRLHLIAAGPVLLALPLLLLRLLLLCSSSSCCRRLSCLLLGLSSFCLSRRCRSRCLFLLTLHMPLLSLLLLFILALLALLVLGRCLQGCKIEAQGGLCERQGMQTVGHGRGNGT